MTDGLRLGFESDKKKQNSVTLFLLSRRRTRDQRR